MLVDLPAWLKPSGELPQCHAVAVDSPAGLDPVDLPAGPGRSTLRPGPGVRWIFPWFTVVAVRGVPWWGVVSTAAAPVLLIGGWTVAAGLQPGSFNAVVSTISALAARGAADRWVMTLALAGTGTCYVLTGLALRPAALPGRLILMAGGVATVLVAANPQPARGGNSLAHTFWAAVGFIALAVWPLAAGRRAPPAPAAPRPAGSAFAGAVLAGLLLWFGAELITAGRQVGLAERILAGAQAAWPLILVLACRRRRAG
jgi:hypothetical membrane protein